MYQSRDSPEYFRVISPVHDPGYFPRIADRLFISADQLFEVIYVIVYDGPGVKSPARRNAASFNHPDVALRRG